MKAMVATKFLTPMVLILGVALPTSAQQPATTFEGFGCKFDLTEIAGVPADFADDVLVTTDTFKRCPGSSPTPTIQMECDLLIPGWDSAISINTRDFICEVNGAQCGINQVFIAPNAQMSIDPVVIGGEVFGDAHLRCSRNTSG